MTETTEPTVTTTDVPAIKPKRKVGRPKKQPKAATADVSAFEGITRDDCCFDCNEKNCVITGMAYCGHPYKGGLHSEEMQDPKCLRRLNEAKRIIARQSGK